MGDGNGDGERRLTRFGEDGGEGRLTALPGTGGAGKQGDLRGDADLGAAALLILSDARITELGETALKDPNPLKRRKAFDELLAGLTAENALAIREQIKAMPQDSAEFRDFHYAWGAVAGSDAVLNGMESKERDMAVTLAGWAGADPSGALAWFNGLSDEQRAKSGELKAGMVHGLADTDPMAAADFVFGLNAKGDNQAEGLLGIVTGEILRSVGTGGGLALVRKSPGGAAARGGDGQRREPLRGRGSGGGGGMGRALRQRA